MCCDFFSGCGGNRETNAERYNRVTAATGGNPCLLHYTPWRFGLRVMVGVTFRHLRFRRVWVIAPFLTTKRDTGRRVNVLCLSDSCELDLVLKIWGNRRMRISSWCHGQELHPLGCLRFQLPSILPVRVFRLPDIFSLDRPIKYSIFLIDTRHTSFVSVVTHFFTAFRPGFVLFPLPLYVNKHFSSCLSLYSSRCTCVSLSVSSAVCLSVILSFHLV